MSQSICSGVYRALVNQIVALDNEIESPMQTSNNSVSDICGEYFQRLSYYEKSYMLANSETDKLLLQDMKDDIYLNLKLYRLYGRRKSDMQLTK